MADFESTLGKTTKKGTGSQQQGATERGSTHANPEVGNENSTSALMGAMPGLEWVSSRFPDLSNAAWDTFNEALFAAPASDEAVTEMETDAPAQEGGEVAAAGASQAAPSGDAAPAPKPLPTTVTTGAYEWTVENGGERFVLAGAPGGLGIGHVVTAGQADAYEKCSLALAEAAAALDEELPQVAAVQAPALEALTPADDTDPDQVVGYLEMALSAGKTLMDLEDTYNPAKVLARGTASVLATVYNMGSWGAAAQNANRENGEAGPSREQDGASVSSGEAQTSATEDVDGEGSDELFFPDATRSPMEGIVYTLGFARMTRGSGNNLEVVAKGRQGRPRWRSETSGGPTGDAPEGLKVRVLEAKTMKYVYAGATNFYSYAKVETLEGQSPAVTEADNKWVRMDNLLSGGSEKVEPEGETADQEGSEAQQAGAEEGTEAEAGLPAGRSPGQSTSGWSTAAGFALTDDGAQLNPELFRRVVALIQWAIDNDMLVGDVIMTDGVRSPKVAHKMSTSFNIQSGRIPLERLMERGPSGEVGTDMDGNVWYVEGDDLEAVKQRAAAIYAQSAVAAEGYTDDDDKWPNTQQSTVSNHLTGEAIDCQLTWRAPNEDASTNKMDVTAYEDIYKRFGLARPAMSGLSESWHIQLAGQSIDGGVEE